MRNGKKENGKGKRRKTKGKERIFTPPLPAAQLPRPSSPSPRSESSLSHSGPSSPTPWGPHSGSPWPPRFHSPPTPVVRRRPRIARVYRSSVKRSRILKRVFPLPVFFRTSVQGLLLRLPARTVLEQVLLRCTLHGHHLQFSTARFFVHLRY
jgi:hypothetical protein